MGGKSTLSSVPKKIEPGTRPEDYFGWGIYKYSNEGSGYLTVTIQPSAIEAGFDCRNWARYALGKEKGKADYELSPGLAEHLGNIQEGLAHLSKRKLLREFQLMINITGEPKVATRSLRVDTIKPRDPDDKFWSGTEKGDSVRTSQIGQVVLQTGQATRGVFSMDSTIDWNPNTVRFTILRQIEPEPASRTAQRH